MGPWLIMVIVRTSESTHRFVDLIFGTALSYGRFQAFHFPDDFASSSDEEDSDEEDAGWLASSTFGTGQGSPRQRNSEPSSLRNGIGVSVDHPP